LVLSIIPLTENYQPKDVLCRDEQLIKIYKVFNDFNEYGVSSNCIILGLPGNGKTVAINKVKSDFNSSHIYISCSIKNNSNKVLNNVYDNFRVDKYRISKDNILELIINKLKSNRKILIIDELNKILDPENLFNYLNTIYRSTQVPIILISNLPHIFEFMPEDCRTTLLFDKIIFQQYSAEELKKIVLDRIQYLNLSFEIPDNSLNQLCAIGARENGNARLLFSALQKCILSRDFSEEIINNIWLDNTKEFYNINYNKLSKTRKLALQIIVECYVKKIPISHHMLKVRLDVSGARVSQLLSSLAEEKFILLAEDMQSNRIGPRFRVPYFESEEKMLIFKGLLEEEFNH